jgi:hypothetical protein
MAQHCGYLIAKPHQEPSMSDYSEATGALDKATELIKEARNEEDHGRRMGQLLMLKEVIGQGVKFQRRAFLAAAGFGSDQGSLPLSDD